MKICFVPKKFGQSAWEMINQANQIISEHQAEGFDLTLRQLYYQFVSRDLLPNTVRSYKLLGSVVNSGRLAGHIDWNAIVDRSRYMRENPHWDSPKSIMEQAAKQYRIDKWTTQKFRLEVWVEKEALIGVLDSVCPELDIPYFACKGYVSQSEMFSAAERIRIRRNRLGQPTIILHLGDHDPSGIDMTLDIERRLEMFRLQYPTFRVIRLALNMDQIQQYQPPPNPAKTTDSRFREYRRKFGDESWELDALEPKAIVQLIRGVVGETVDQKAWGKALQKEKRESNTIKKLAKGL